MACICLSIIVYYELLLYIMSIIVCYELLLYIRPDKLDLLFLISARFYVKHPASTFIIAFCLGHAPINAINNHVMSRETSLMASAHGHLSQARCHSFACQYYMAVGQLFPGQSLKFL